MARKPTLTNAMESIARGLREFGYPDVTAAMIREIYDAWNAGKHGFPLPHGVIGMFAKRQFEENAALLRQLDDTAKK